MTPKVSGNERLAINMTVDALPKNLPTLLRSAGLKVVEIDGWEHRLRPGSFHATGVLNHHTGASAKGWALIKEAAYARWMALTGRDDLPAPLVQLSLGRSGTVYICAAGRSNHAGTAKPSGTVAGGDGNTLYIGIEWMLSGVEDIPSDMLRAGITLNAVLIGQVTKTSAGTISCHYNTSVTGKWDIGDPNGVRFGDKMVLDIEKFRRAVAVERDRLYNAPPAPPVEPPVTDKPYVDLRLAHFSGLHDNSPKQWTHDCETVLARGYEWVTSTEAGASDDWSAIKAAADKFGYRVWRYKSNWVAIKKSAIVKGSVKVETKTVVTNDEVKGRGYDTNYLSVSFTHTTKGLGRPTVVCSHYPLAGRPDAKDPARRINLRWTRKIANAVSAVVALGAKGGNRLGFYGGDQNIPDDESDTFFGGPVTSAGDETGSHPGTGHGPIDVIASADADRRVRCLSWRVLDDHDLFLYGDHDLCEAVYRVTLR